jgi:hypothetical protein
LIKWRTKHHAVHVQAVEEILIDDLQRTKIDGPVLVVAAPC